MPRRSSLYLILSCLMSTLALPPSVFSQTDRTAALDALVAEAVAKWQVPGAAVAIVQRTANVYLKGFGVRKLGRAASVTPETVFPLASCSKAFITTALAMLVDEGKMDWDDPVRKHLDTFHLADPLADANVTIRDLLTHRTGLG